MSGYKRVNFYELCRLCATNQQKDKTHIFQEEGRKIQLQNKIQSCLSLTVCENDFLPKVVCSKCLRTLEVCYFFRQECVTSESMLSSYFKNFRYTEDFKKSGKVYIKDTTTTKCTITPPQYPNNLQQPPQQQQQQQNEVVTSSTTNNNYTSQIDTKPITDTNLPFYTLQLPTATLQIDGKNQHHLGTVVTTTTTTSPIGVTVASSGGGGIVGMGIAGGGVGATGIKIEPNGKILTNQIAYNLNTINLAAVKTNNNNSNKICNNNNNLNESNVIVNANGEVINVAQFLDFESIINHTNNLQQKIVTNKKLTNHRTTLSSSRQLVGNTVGNSSNGGIMNKEEEALIKVDLTEGAANDYDTGQSRSLKKWNQIKVEDNKNTVIFNNPLNDFTNYNSNNNNFVTNNLYQSSTVGSTTTPSASSTSTTTAIVTPPTLEQSTVNLNVLNQDYQIRKLVSNSSTNTTSTTTPITTTSTNASTLTSSIDQPIKTHICDICQKSFKRREHLYQHVKLHTGFRPYSCDSCNKSFMRKEHLLRHQTSHSGQKNFTCNICDKSFSRNDNLLKHKKTHDKQSSYVCEVCQKQFVMKHYYLSHKLIHDNNIKCSNSSSNNSTSNNNTSSNSSSSNVWNVLKT